MKRPIIPLVWLSFSAGGTIAALLYPVHLFLSGLAFPLEWVKAPSYESLHGLLLHPLTRLYLFVLISLPLVHSAHRFRYTLYDSLQLYHLTRFIAAVCYGAAAIGTGIAAYTLWNIS